MDDVFQMDDTRKGHNCLKKYLQKFLSSHPDCTIFCAVESTGGLENNWHAMLIALGNSLPVKVFRLNPAVVKSNAVASLNRNITDSLSAQFIAEYILDHALNVNYGKQNDQYAAFRSLNRHITIQKKQKTQLVYELRIILYSVFPEITTYCKSKIPKWLYAMLEIYPTPASMKGLQVEDLTQIKYMTPAREKAILKRVEQSIASRTEESDAYLVRELCAQIVEKEARITKNKKYLEKHCKGPEVELLKTITGVGPYSAAAIMIEIEDINRFPTPAKLASYFGLHPVIKESGDKKSQGQMSKKGRASMRGTLFMCANSAVIHQSHMKEIYHKHRSQGKGHKQALGVIMDKLIRIIWGMLTHNKPFDAKTDKANQEKKVKKVANQDVRELNHKRRFQELDEDAPISKRLKKKRKAHLESQAEPVG